MNREGALTRLTTNEVLRGQLKNGVVCGLIGLLVGLGSVAVLLSHELLWDLLTSVISSHGYVIIIFTTVGMVLGYSILKVVGREGVGCGTHRLLEAYHYSCGEISEKESVGSAAAAVLTIGFGGSAGLEGPGLLMGGGIASWVAKKTRVQPDELKIYMLSGAAAGLSAVFKAPLTGILFALEIPYQRDLVKDAFIPATFSSLVAYFVSVGFLGPQYIFAFASGPLLPSPSTILHALLLGLLAALCGRFFIFVYLWTGRIAGRLKKKGIVLPIVSGGLVGLIGLYTPQVLGLGYGTINDVLSGELNYVAPVFIFIILIMKIFATSLTVRMGSTGGIFIPTIFVGALLGLLYSRVVLQFTDIRLVMATMAAMMASTNKTLLASVALVSETVGPSSIILSLVSATTAFFTSGRSSFYKGAQPLAETLDEKRSLEILYHMIRESGYGGLSRVKVSEVMVPDPIFVKRGMSIRECFEVVKAHEFRVYPVVDEEMRVTGFITIEDLFIIPEERWDLRIEDITIRAPILAKMDEDLASLVERMIEKTADHAYVVLEDGRLVGVVATMDIIKKLVGIL
ncbi:MAG: chloride channel protein [Candidatus Methanomethylicaceae archaeon]